MDGKSVVWIGCGAQCVWHGESHTCLSLFLSFTNQARKEEEKEFESEKGMVKDERHTGVGDGLMKAQWLMCCMPHTTLHSTPYTFWSTPFSTQRETEEWGGEGRGKGESGGGLVWTK